MALRVLVDMNAVEAFAQDGRAQYSFPGILRSVGSGWNMSVRLQAQTASPVTVDVGIWPINDVNKLKQ